MTGVVVYGLAKVVLGGPYKVRCAGDSFVARCSACNPAWVSTWILSLNFARDAAVEHAATHPGFEVREIPENADSSYVEHLLALGGQRTR